MTACASVGHLGHASNSTVPPLRNARSRTRESSGPEVSRLLLPDQSNRRRKRRESTRVAADPQSHVGLVSRSLTSRHSGGLLFRPLNDVAVSYALLSVGLVAGGMLAGGTTWVAVLLGLVGLATGLACVAVLLCRRVMHDIVGNSKTDSPNRPLPGASCGDLGQDIPGPVCVRRPQ